MDVKTTVTGQVSPVTQSLSAEMLWPRCQNFVLGLGFVTSGLGLGSGPFGLGLEIQ